MINKKLKRMALICGLVLSFPVSTYAALVTGGECTELSLTPDGAASWNGPNVAGEQVEKYELKLSIMRNGSWDDGYKSARSDVNTHEFSFGKTGKYRFKVRARFYGGNYGAWSADSPAVVVTRDDINNDSWSDDEFSDPFEDIVNSQNENGHFGPGYRPDGSYLEGGYPGGFQSIGPGAGSGIIQTEPGYPVRPNFTTVAPGYPNNNNYNQFSPSATPNQGWIKGNAGWWYKYADGSYPRNSWQRINDKWYFFNMDGIMQTGWIWWNNSWYLALPDGSMATGWQNVNERWYYMNGSGIMLTGYQIIDGKTYYLDATGARVSGGYAPDGHLFDDNGVMIK